MNVNKKILQYLDYKGISQRSFTKKCGLSEGVLRNGKGIGSIYLHKIKNNHPDLNWFWVLFDEGNMILKDTYSLEQTENYVHEEITPIQTVKENCKKQLFELQQTVIQIQGKLIKCKEELENCDCKKK